MWHEAWYREKSKGESLARQGWNKKLLSKEEPPKRKNQFSNTERATQTKVLLIGLIFFGSQLLSTWPLLLYRNLIYCNQAPTKGVRNQRLLFPNGTAPNVRTRSKVVVRNWLKILQSNIFCTRQSFCAAWLLFTTWGEAIWSGIEVTKAQFEWYGGVQYYLWEDLLPILYKPFQGFNFAKNNYCLSSWMEKTNQAKLALSWQHVCWRWWGSYW